jgi:hypothetical protein
MLKFALGAAAPVILLATPLYADPVVIKYEGPSAQIYKPGKKLAAGAAIQLKSGEVLTVLDERGTRVLRGPGKFSASSAASAGKVSNKSLMSIMKTSNVRRARTGAVRGTPPSSNVMRRSPNLWYIDIKKPGAICVADFGKMQFWRSDVTNEQSLQLKDLKSGKTGNISFPKGLSSAGWPSGVMPVDGGTYELGAAGAADIAAINLVQMPITAEQPLVDVTVGLLDRGCQAQGELLAETFAQAERAPAGG